MKRLETIVSLASAAALVFSMGASGARMPLAFAADPDVASASASASSEESSSAESTAAPGSVSSAAESSDAGGTAAAAGETGKATSAKGPGASEERPAKSEASTDKAKKRAAKKVEKKEKKSKGGAAKPKASGKDPAVYAGRLAGLAGKLDAVPDDIGKAKNIARAYKKKLAALSKRKASLEKERQRAQNVLDEMRAELENGADATLAMVLTGRAGFDSIDSRGYLLQKVADDSSARIADAQAELDRLSKRRVQLKKREAAEMRDAVKNHRKEVAATIARGNALAAKIERNVSFMKHAEPDLSASRAALREESLAAVARWYEFEDTLAGNEGVLTFGAGADFDLSKKAFVKKWSAAIDAFYKNSYPGSPLEGHGAEMARAAWEHKIDPRLCAAVSIIESTGGRYCIKPHNAWGWGAADSDPYGGASGWGSWAEAIEAWHDGLASSTTGLATAPTVEELGEIYCSSLDWAAKVVKEMQKISAEADAG